MWAPKAAGRVFILRRWSIGDICSRHLAREKESCLSRVADIQARELQAAASTLGRQLHILHASSRRDIDTAFANLVPLQASGLMIGSDPFFNSWSEQLAVLELRHAVPAIYEIRAFAAGGGLLKLEGGITVLDVLGGVYVRR